MAGFNEYPLVKPNSESNAASVMMKCLIGCEMLLLPEIVRSSEADGDVFSDFKVCNTSGIM